MGKGRRARNQRQQAVHDGSAPQRTRPAPAADYPFEVDDHTRQNLGTSGLAELASNLWPKDCQTCGWALGSDPPTVFCKDMGALMYASLHHRRCQPATWSEGMIMAGSASALVSFDVLAFLLPSQFRPSDGGPARRDDLPVFFVNPSLEVLMLTRTQSGWENQQLKIFRQAGLRPMGPDLVMDRPLSNATARLDVGELSVGGLPVPEQWSCGIDVPFREAVEDRGGVWLAVTPATVPSQMRTLGEFFDLAQTDRLVMGFVELDPARS